MTDQDQHDFDEFDTLVDDNADSTDDLSFDKPDTGRKKRQAVFYIVLLAFVGLVLASVWFVFLRQPENSGEAQPLPLAAADQQTGQENAANSDLPPGISPANETAPSPLTPVDNTGETAAAAPIQAPDMATPQPITPAETTATAHTGSGTTVEALPPPVPATGTEGAAPTPAPVDMAGNTEPQALSPVVPEPVQQAPDTTTPAPEMTGIAPTAPTAPAAVEAPKVTNALTPATETANPAPVATAATADPAIQQRLNQIEEQIRTISTAAPSGTATTGQPDEALKAQLKALSDKLDNLATQVDSLDQRTTNFATELQNRGDDAPSMTTSAPEAKPHSKPVAKKAPTKPRKAPARTAAKSVTASWELRSAQPGVAWLGKPGSGEMSRFAIGQSVPGLGTVQDVSQEAGRWIVKTSGGTLRQ